MIENSDIYQYLCVNLTDTLGRGILFCLSLFIVILLLYSIIIIKKFNYSPTYYLSFLLMFFLIPNALEAHDFLLGHIGSKKQRKKYLRKCNSCNKMFEMHEYIYQVNNLPFLRLNRI